MNGRQTREYGDPDALAAAALVDEVVSSSHETRRDDSPPTTLERPSKEVDWGEWPTASALGSHPEAQLESGAAVSTAARPVEPQEDSGSKPPAEPTSILPESLLATPPPAQRQPRRQPRWLRRWPVKRKLQRRARSRAWQFRPTLGDLVNRERDAQVDG